MEKGDANASNTCMKMCKQLDCMFPYNAELSVKLDKTKCIQHSLSHY